MKNRLFLRCLRALDRHRPVIGIYREEDLSNGVETRFSWFKRWNFDPMITWRPLPKVQARLVGKFLHEEGFKLWGDHAQLAPGSSSNTMSRASAASAPRSTP